MGQLELKEIYYFRAPRDRNYNSTIIPKGCLYVEILLGGIVVYEGRIYKRGALFAQSEGMETIHDFQDRHPYRALLVVFSGYDPSEHPLPHIGAWMNKASLEPFVDEIQDAFFEGGNREELRNYIFAAVEWHLMRSQEQKSRDKVSYHNILETRELLARPDFLYDDWPGLSRRAGYSPAYLTTLFKNEFGITPYQFYLKTRLDRAAAALAESDASIRQISIECGFQNIESFYRAFKRRFGKTPNQYRAHH